MNFFFFPNQWKWSWMNSLKYLYFHKVTSPLSSGANHGIRINQIIIRWCGRGDSTWKFSLAEDLHNAQTIIIGDTFTAYHRDRTYIIKLMTYDALFVVCNRLSYLLIEMSLACGANKISLGLLMETFHLPPSWPSSLQTRWLYLFYWTWFRGPTPRLYLLAGRRLLLGV